MTEQFDERLESAGRVLARDAAVDDALHALVTERTAPRRSRRRRILIPALSVAAALGIVGTGAVAASEWGPWTYVADPDIVIAQDWEDVDGTALGSCESRLAMQALPEEQRAATRDYLASLDLDTVELDTAYMANVLVAVGRPDDLGRLVAGANVADYDTMHTGPLWSDEWWSDARIMQDGLTQAIFTGIAAELGSRWPEVADNGLEVQVETKCTTDPTSADTH